MKKSTNITIFGAGYVGLTTAVIFANSGYGVQLLENNTDKLKILNSGKSFFYEHGVDSLLARALKNESLVISKDVDLALDKADVVFSCVGTPDNPDGSSNLEYVFAVANSVISSCKENVIFVQKSTVPVGTGQIIEDLFAKHNSNVKYASNPEFLREGSAIQDSLWFDRIVVGSNNPETINEITDIYKTVESNRQTIAEIAKIQADYKALGQYIKTSRNSAELTKVSANAFLALKISFANSIAKLADESGADVIEVMDAIGSDRRIGRAFLNAGRGYGGGCFPKDVSGLISSAEHHSVDMPLMVATVDVNDSMADYIANKAKDALGSLKGKKVAVLGLAFKAGTSDARKSPGVKLANILNKSGSIVAVYDPRASDEAKEDLWPGIKIQKSIESATSGCDAVFIATDWKEFIEYDYNKLKTLMSGKIIVDTVNCLDPNDIKSVGFKYIGVGRN